MKLYLTYMFFVRSQLRARYIYSRSLGKEVKSSVIVLLITLYIYSRSTLTDYIYVCYTYNRVHSWFIVIVYNTGS